MKVNLRRGLFRIWIVGAVVWYAYALITHGHEIGHFWGYWQGLLTSNSTFSDAVAESERTQILIDSCREARRVVCEYVHTEKYFGEWHCPDMQSLLEEQKAQALARGLAEARDATNPAACDIFYELRLPRIRWLLALEVLLAPIVPLFAYLVGRWVKRGFRPTFTS